MADNFFLGFKVDTADLLRAAETARKFADEVSKLGNAEQETAKKTDQATAATQRKKKATDDAAEAQRKAAGATGAFAQKLEGISGNLKRSQEDLQQLANAMGGSGGMGGLVGGVNAGAGALGRLAGALGPVGAGLAAGTLAVGALGFGYYKAAEALAVYQDRQAAMEGKLKSALGSISQAREVLDTLRESAIASGLSFDAASEAFGRIARNNAAIGLTTKEMLQMVETVQKLGVVSGASGGEMQSGMIQFGQALASGRLQGDELRSIMENFPALAKAIADNFEKVDGTIGITIGDLRRMGSEGELTSIKIAQAMLRAKEETEKQFAEMPETVERANQRITDSYNAVLTDLGKMWDSSGFVRSVKGLGLQFLEGFRDALKDPTLQQQLEDLDKRLKYAREFNSQSAFTRGMLLSGGGNGMPAVGALPGNVNQLEAERTRILQEIETKAADDREIARKQEEQAILGPIASVMSRTGELKTFAEEQRNANLTVKDLKDAIAGLTSAINARKSLGLPLDNLPYDLTNAQDRLVIAQQRSSNVQTELMKLSQSAGDRQRAIGIGGDGGAAYVLQAIAAQRADNAKNAASSLGAYISQLLRDDVASSTAGLAGVQRQTANTLSGIDLIQADRATRTAAEVQQKYNEEAAKFGEFAKRPEVLAYLERYKAAQQAAADATNKAADANRRIASQEDAYYSGLMADPRNADPRAARRQGLENQLARERRTFSSQADFDAYAQNKRQGLFDDEAIQLNQANRQYDLRLRQLEEQEQLIGLTSDELQVQNAILAKQMELWSQGYEAGDARFDTEVRRTEELERSAVAQRNRQAQVKSIFNSLQDGVRQFEGVFKNSFETIFTDGVRKGGDIFLKGFGDIIKKISAQMIYDIALKPFEVLAQQLATNLGRWLVSFLPGGGGGAPLMTGSSYGYSGGTPAANGAYFDGMNHNFAYGGAFTNQVVNRPTMFAFASGVGLMGEAGPEAIMPLKRDSTGRLGVYASGGGGGNDSGLSVVINDMRSNANSERVQTSEQRGPNGKRVLSVLIRDEMRRQIRSGDLDREMSGSYGNTRTLARL